MAERPLIGLSPDQVSTNGMLGDLAFQDSNSAYIETIRGKVSLDKLDKSIEDTAVDIFVYDTRKDSDSGAWRKRTQHTSWYNETLNTATRGSRREFPAVAVIVISNDSAGLTIYDGDDPDLPMWMVFNETAGQSIWQGTDRSSVAALNGIIVVGQLATIPLPIIGFVADEMYNRRTDTTKYNISNIAGRNTGGYSITGYFDQGLVNTTAYDVAMTVLPSAPIDDATGLPVPTIAVATNGGVSVIKDDGTVVDITWSSYGAASSVYFKDNYLWLTNDSGIFNKGGRYLKKYSIPSSDISESHGYLRNSALKYWASPWGFLGAYTGTSYPPLLGSNAGFYGPTVGPYWGSSDGTNGGLTIIGDEGTTTTDGLVAYATTSYNTGWMHGDIKGAFLSDTTAESLTANTNLATNATEFGTDRLTSETYDDGDTSWQMVDNAGNANGYVMIQLNGLTVGQSYLISVTFDNNNALDSSYQHRIDHNGGSSGSTSFTYWNKTNASSETLTGLFTAQTVNSEYFVLYANAITLNVSNFIVRAVDDEDRSVNNNGLQVFGTVTKSAVATGAELVAYSGFSASNYLQQPYNSDLDFGTGDLSISFWYKMTSTASYQCLFHRGDGASGTWGSGNIIQIEMDGTYLEFQIAGPSFSPLTQVQVPVAQSATGQWQHFVGVRSGGVMSVYIDSVKYGNVASTQNATNTSAKTWIGERPYATRPATNTSLALFRMSATAPSPEQIKKMYEDEKVLFQENAACTLYGSSDAVTALAYDDSTNLLYAGTSSGRSDFQGLRRINNTTTAVTTAMSASNGLVAEQ